MTKKKDLKPFEIKVDCSRGAPMGRRSLEASNLSGPVHLERVTMYDGDYDKGGAYWGGGFGTDPLFCMWNDEGAVYLRAKNIDDAKRQLLEENPDLEFTL